MEIIEECLIPFPPQSATLVPSTFPLTLFDYPWLRFPTMKPLFFFQLPFHTHYLDFTSNILPQLKHSLSSALYSYFPMAGKLAASSGNPENLFLVTDGDCTIKLTVAHSDADFENLSSYSTKKAEPFHHLVPSLPLISCPPNYPTPLLAIQITYFPTKNPNSTPPGFSIGISYHPVLFDQRCFCKFLHSWAALCKSGHISRGPVPPTFDRSVIMDPNGLGPTLSGQLLEMKFMPVISPCKGLLRATFVMSQKDTQDAKRWIMAMCDKHNRPYPILLSPYIVVCAFVWTCLSLCSVNKAKGGPMYLGFIAGGITRLNYRVPYNYFGNCVGFGRARVVKREELSGVDGILAAADALAVAIKALDIDVLGGADNWISEWEVFDGSAEHVNVVGSPKVKLYETDFGWGRPQKIEEISIDGMRKGISLTESRDTKGGIEIGIALNKSSMGTFCGLFNHGLRCFSSDDSF